MTCGMHSCRDSTTGRGEAFAKFGWKATFVLKYPIVRPETAQLPNQCYVFKLPFLLLHKRPQLISLPWMVYVSYTVAASNCSHRDAGKMCLFLPAQ